MRIEETFDNASRSFPLTAKDVPALAQEHYHESPDAPVVHYILDVLDVDTQEVDRPRLLVLAIRPNHVRDLRSRDAVLLRNLLEGLTRLVPRKDFRHLRIGESARLSQYLNTSVNCPILHAVRHHADVFENATGLGALYWVQNDVDGAART